MSWTLKLSALKVADLFDTGSASDKQDPCLTLSLNEGKIKIGKTKRKKDSGVQADFDETYEIPVDEAIWRTGSLDVEVSNENLFGSLTHIGKGSIKLVAALALLNQPTSVIIPLVHYIKGLPGPLSGQCTLICVIHAPVSASAPVAAPAPAPAIAAPAAVTVAPAAVAKSAPAPVWKLSLDQIAAYDLHDNGTALDKQDPMVKIFLADKQLGQTHRKKDAGTEASWSESFENLALDQADYETKELRVEVYNENFLGVKTHLGTGSIKLKDAVKENCINGFVTFAIQLHYHPNAKEAGEQKGVLTMRALVSASNKLEPNAATLAAAQYVAPVKPVVSTAKPAVAAAVASPVVSAASTAAPSVAAVAAAAADGTLASFPWKMTLDTIQARDLFNVGTALDKQDPMVKLFLADKEIGHTHRKKDAGTEVTQCNVSVNSSTKEKKTYLISLAQSSSNNYRRTFPSFSPT